MPDRLRYAIHWKQKYNELEATVREHGYDILGERDSEEFRRMRRFSQNVGDILPLVADTLQPGTLEEFVEYAFDGARAGVQPVAAARPSGGQVK